MASPSKQGEEVDAWAMSFTDGDSDALKPLIGEEEKNAKDAASKLQVGEEEKNAKDAAPTAPLTPPNRRRSSEIAKFDKFNFTEESISNKKRPQKVPSKEDLAMNGDKISRVEQSWYIISGKIGEVGLRFFLEMFDAHPDFVQLFPFGEDSIDPVSGRLKINERTKAHVRAHATAVMRVVGTCVAGLTSIEDLIPRLRTVGATHKTVGVKTMHYDILYKHLVSAIREEVGPENWDQETEDAWEQAFISISDMIKRPSKRLETEPLRGWGIVMLVACTYFMVVTPFRFAGFLYGHADMVVLLNFLDTVAALVMAFDLCIHYIQTRFRVGEIKQHANNNQNNLLANAWNKAMNRFKVKFRRSLVGKLQTYRMDRWVPWASLDAKVLLSFPLQWMYVRTSICAQIGLHWSQLFGLLRVLTATRVLHFLQCAENNALIEQKLNAERQVQLRVAKLLLRLAFIVHFSACMWCTVARIQLGVNATEFKPSPFFPSEDIIYGSSSDVFKAYSRAIHWAFVNLSGIGGVDSEPVTTLEVWTILIVHMIGAVFYAVITGNVIAILEDETKRENQIGTEIVKLSAYLNMARVSDYAKDRIMKGFMMRNVLTQVGQEGPQGDAHEGPDLDDDILSTLPKYLRMEVAIYARAEFIHRRDKFFTHCSQGFLVALSGCLGRTRTLLTGDYLMQRGEPYQPNFVLVEQGSLQVRQGHDTIKTLRKGDCIGKAWLLQMTFEEDEGSEKTGWMMNNGKAAVSIRALSPCTLLTGLNTVAEIDQLERGYKVDFQLLRAELRGSAKSEIERKAIAVKVIAKAVRRKFSKTKSGRLSSRSLLDASGEFSIASSSRFSSRFSTTNSGSLRSVAESSDGEELG